MGPLTYFPVIRPLCRPIVLPGKPELAETLVRISNDYMTRFYVSLSTEYGSKFNLASCYEALSIYLCRRYEDVLGVCEKLLDDSECDSELEKCLFLNVSVSLNFIAYFDDDIRTLVGFQILVLYLSSTQHDVLETISETYNETYKPILRKQFLGNYLKLRCLLDLGFPLFEVKSAYRCLKGRFLFERTLVHFMRHKIICCYSATAINRKADRLSPAL